MAFPFEQTKILFTQGCFFAKFGWNWPSGSIEEDFKTFTISLLSSLGKMCGPSYILLQRMLCNKFGWNLRTNVVLLFRNYLPLEKSRALHLSKLKFPSAKDDFCQVWLILAQWICRSCELRPVSRKNVNKYRIPLWHCFFVVSVFIKKGIKGEKICNQYEAHKVYFYYVCVNMTS